MEEAERFDWLIAMNEGRILATGTPAELKAQTGGGSIEAAFVALLPQRPDGRSADMPEKSELDGSQETVIVARDDDRLLTAIELGFLRHVGGATIRPLRQQRDEGRLDRASTGLRLELGRRTGRQNAPLIHRDQPVEQLGLLHIGGEIGRASCRERV